jgi:hypothetical protein
MQGWEGCFRVLSPSSPRVLAPPPGVGSPATRSRAPARRHPKAQKKSGRIDSLDARSKGLPALRFVENKEVLGQCAQ